ncbi:ABC transporter B family member 29, chloroplastic-like [Asparagus officinalis]|uniref:ABC transporter B family member 29, chloroplastic-like n=1 Tax=Asparagus officinalis TaxID=4686 RepID=UPI00098E7EC1|nr:ABC transporter B family member 29, chloroplastic-like [Asparagus officinalis]XP_020265670.1 ABC transporter B family member 29, chloroplastic-like [Asparagus officinalis]XP_020265671.1 ABC transporter B family member 29, chloroplastic-like [Asparagus officinalis]
MVVVKANNGEFSECSRFQRHALDDLVQRSKKRKMKALIHLIVQVICIGGLILLCAGSLIVSRNSSGTSSLVSFITSLILLVEPLRPIYMDIMGMAFDEHVAASGGEARVGTVGSSSTVWYFDTAVANNRDHDDRDQYDYDE